MNSITVWVADLYSKEMHFDVSNVCAITHGSLVLVPGHAQSPAGSFALTSTLPYVKLNDSTVRILAEAIGFSRFVADPVLSQPQSCGLVHLQTGTKTLVTCATLIMSLYGVPYQYHRGI